MTVRELIAELEKCNPDLEVVVNGPYGWEKAEVRQTIADYTMNHIKENQNVVIIGQLEY